MIVESVRQSTALRVDLLTATAALAQIAGRGLQLDHSSSINKAKVDRICPLIPSRSIKQTIGSTRRHSDRVAPRSKSP